jgi:hypothetical protein
MAHINLDNNEILFAETNTRKVQNRDLVMKCISIIKRHISSDTSIINRRNVFDILIHSINLIADTESEFIEHFNASLVFLMYIYKHPDRLSAVRWAKKKCVELYLNDAINDQISESFYSNDEQTEMKLNYSHATIRKAILDCYSSSKMMGELNNSSAYISSARKMIKEIKFKKRFFGIYSKPIETSFDVTYRLNHDETSFDHDNTITMRFKCIASVISFLINIPTGTMTFIVSDDDDISNFDCHMLTHIFSNWVRYLVYPGGNEMCDFRLYDRISKDSRQTKCMYYMKMTYRGIVSRSFVINRKIVYWWVLNYAALGDRPDFGTHLEQSLWNMEMHHELLKKVTKKTVDCIFHTDVSPSFFLIPLKSCISHYSGVVFIDKEESIFDHPLYNHWADCINIFPQCSCSSKDRGYVFYDTEKASKEDFAWFHDALFRGIFSLPSISFGISEPCSSSSHSDIISITAPTSPVEVKLYLIHDAPSNGGDVIGGGIKFPTLRLVEGYKYKIVVDPINIIPVIVEKCISKTFSVWHEMDDGRKVVIASYNIFNANPDPFTATIHKNMKYGEIDSTNWGFIEIATQQEYLDTMNDFSLFMDHKYRPEVVIEKNRLLMLESSITKNLNAVQLGVDGSKYQGQLIVFFLDNYDENDDINAFSKMDRNILYKDVATRGFAKTFIIKYAKCMASDLPKLFSPENDSKIVHDISKLEFIEIQNISKYRFLYLLHPSIAKTLPLAPTLPNMIRITAKGKTQSVYCINLKKHKKISADDATSITSSANVKEAELSTSISFGTYLKFATLKVTSQTA